MSLRVLDSLGSILSILWRVGMGFFGLLSLPFVFRYLFTLREKCRSLPAVLLPIPVLLPRVVMNFVLDSLFHLGDDVSFFPLDSRSRYFLIRGLLRAFKLYGVAFFQLGPDQIVCTTRPLCTWVHAKALKEVFIFVFPLRSFTYNDLVLLCGAMRSDVDLWGGLLGFRFCVFLLPRGVFGWKWSVLGSRLSGFAFRDPAQREFVPSVWVGVDDCFLPGCLVGVFACGVSDSSCLVVLGLISFQSDFWVMGLTLWVFDPEFFFLVRQLLASRAKELSLYFCSLAPHQTLILMEGCIKLIQTVSLWMILLSLWILIVKFFQVLFPQSSIF